MADTETKYPLVQFRIVDDGMDEQIQQRTSGPGTSPSQVARRDLERYYYMLQVTLAKLDPPLTEGEACLICDVSNGWHVEPYSAALLWANVADSADDGYGDKWGVDVSALAQRLRALPPFACMAIVDAAERWWSDENIYQDPDRATGLRRVGLLPAERAPERMARS